MEEFVYINGWEVYFEEDSLMDKLLSKILLCVFMFVVEVDSNKVELEVVKMEIKLEKK